jgi:hypothetical protein
MSDPLYGRSWQDGLHVLKEEWGQKLHLREQSEHLAESLPKAIEVTEAKCPRRMEGFQLERAETLEIDSTERERRWERSILLRWNASGLSPVEDCWHRLVAFQVPLFDSQEKEGWGYIDLLGVLGDGTPVVVEAKKEPRTKASGGTDNSESPLRMVLEAASYAVCLRCNWATFRPEFVRRLRELGVEERVADSVPEQLKTVRIVGTAPAAYWIDWLPVTAKGRTVEDAAWQAFERLLGSLKKAGLLASFVSISGDVDVPGSLAAQPLKRFPIYPA